MRLSFSLYPLSLSTIYGNRKAISEKIKGLSQWVKNFSIFKSFTSYKKFRLLWGNRRSCPGVHPGTRPWNYLRSSVSVWHHTNPSNESRCARPSRARRTRCTLVPPPRVSWESREWGMCVQCAIGWVPTPPCGCCNILAGVHNGLVEFGGACCPPRSPIPPAISPSRN